MLSLYFLYQDSFWFLSKGLKIAEKQEFMLELLRLIICFRVIFGKDGIFLRFS